MTQQFNGLDPAEAERLFLLSEELAEVIQAIGKTLRHGYDSRHPNGGLTNRENLERELGHVIHAYTRMIAADDVSEVNIKTHRLEKATAVGKYLHHQ